jgi:hypothetical protein
MSATLSHVSEDGYQISEPGPDGPPAVRIERDEDGGYRVTVNPDFSRSMRPAGHWVKISSGDLPMPVELRVNRHADGRYVVTGLLMGDEFSPAEITSQTLREIRLSKILAWLLEDFDPDNLPAWSPRTTVRTIADFNADLAGQVATGRGQRAPGTEVLREFARTYLTELARQPRRAMTAAAKAHSISRATANRWAATCRELGLLPAASSGEESSS